MWPFWFTAWYLLTPFIPEQYDTPAKHETKVHHVKYINLEKK